jgi:hypothetical protein
LTRLALSGKVLAVIRSVFRTLAVLILLASMLGWPMHPVQPAHAAEEIVSVCDWHHLLDAIDATPAGGTVTFDRDCTIGLLQVAIEVKKPLTIDGGTHKVTLRGPSAPQPLIVVYPQTQDTSGVTLRNLTIEHSWTSLVDNFGRLTVVNSTLVDSSPGRPQDDGGGIWNGDGGTLTVIHSTISHNEANLGGGIFSQNGAVTVIDSTISGNSARLFDSEGGGIDINSGTLTVVNSTISGNSSDFTGGGIATDGRTTVSGSTFMDNSAGVMAETGGGGILNGRGGVLTVVNSTFSGNRTIWWGGGIYNDGHATVVNSTFSGNDAFEGSSIYGSVTLRNTILANPIGHNGHDFNCVGETDEIIDGGGNVEDGASCGFGPSRSNLSLDLGPLGNYGGPTPTFVHMVAQPPLPGNPCAFGTLDQRGYYVPFPVCLPGASQPNAIQPTGAISLADVGSQIGRTIVISATVSGAIFYIGPGLKKVSVPYPNSQVRPTGTITFSAPLNEGKPIPCAEGDPVTHAVPLPDTTSPQTVTCTYTGVPLYGNQIIEPVWAQYSGDSLFHGYTTPVTPITIQVASPD